ncbi:MAG TPA: hypothetical protein VGR06_08840 [Actinophytocola sp.]|uniref:hypothetical protein n=1 Tax=Actinophytocola sp. TaxID=1872138 RepID=UPI002DFA7210|nr:hypothetical protein [Actinophytocola sp.]
MHRPRVCLPPVPAGIGFPLGFLAAVVAATAAVGGGATAHPDLALVALIGVVVAIAAVSTLGATLGTAAVSWALQAGFVLGRHGDLALTTRALRDAIILAAAALLAAVVTALIRAMRHRLRATAVTIPTPRSASAPRNPPTTNAPADSAAATNL